ncbi:398R [Invertebrate iridescent virus Kaz2018]|uniref:398R n=1 Tax=Invertebrate iridescent virus 6 TaxID=176652 RepID=Q91FC7_IIV6|nr:398R [Invertebrate iridescent virus 6]AAK82258.1 398R [Invertebrate iridescent virus 6]QMS79422.1 hypothetical protein IIV6-T1_391 [Invertebrate iridescent virus 6]QNH08808.1 398R [Invertebrate iridescent virus Kaz2018]
MICNLIPIRAIRYKCSAVICRSWISAYNIDCSVDLSRRNFR